MTTNNGHIRHVVPRSANDRLASLDTHSWLWYAEGIGGRLQPTASTRGIALATRDKDIIAYGKRGFLRVVEL
jgi:hypothetical protein